MALGLRRRIAERRTGHVPDLGQLSARLARRARRIQRRDRRGDFSGRIPDFATPSPPLDARFLLDWFGWPIRGIEIASPVHRRISHEVAWVRSHLSDLWDHDGQFGPIKGR